jgi:hypothetical protein
MSKIIATMSITIAHPRASTHLSNGKIMRARHSGFNASIPLVARRVNHNVRPREALRVTAEVAAPVIKIGTRGRSVHISFKPASSTFFCLSRPRDLARLN